MRFEYYSWESMEMNEQGINSLTLTNYKRFPSIRLDLSKDCLVISGENGSGKTQLLWGCLIFIHVFNRAHGKNQENAVINLNARDFSILLCCSAFSALKSYVSFANRCSQNHAGQFVQLKGDFQDGSTATINLHLNGKADLEYSSEFTLKQKIRFAYQSLGFHFCHPEEEIRGNLDVLTSAFQNMRGLYSQLSTDRQSELKELMKDLFEICDIQYNPDDFSLYVSERQNEKLEVMHCGSALQKVLSGFILLETLIQANSVVKYFFVEEIEALLYPSLVLRYFQIISNLCARHKIKMVISSNSQQIIEHNPGAKLYLSLKIPGEVEYESTVGEFLGFVKGNPKPVVLCDGGHDQLFLEFALPAEIRKNYQVMHAGSMYASNFLLARLADASGRKIIRLKDPEFLPSKYHDVVTNNFASDISGGRDILLLFHAFNSVESYFILNGLLNNKEEIRKLLNHLKNPAALDEFKVGLDNAYNGNKLGLTKASLCPAGEFYFESFRRWTDVPKLVEERLDSKSNIESELLADLVTLVQGHSYVKDTPELIKAAFSGTIHSFVQEKIDKVIEKIVSALPSS